METSEKWSLTLCWAFFHILDILTTFIFMSAGYPEGNPVVRFMFDLFGFGSYNVIFIIIASVLLLYSDKRLQKIGKPESFRFLMLLLIVVKFLTVVGNIYFISNI